jgi:thioredoxin reductase (NADPH)
MFESSSPGIFAVRDVGARSIKRVTATVGEGAAAIALVHGTLHERPQHCVGGVE